MICEWKIVGEIGPWMTYMGEESGAAAVDSWIGLSQQGEPGIGVIITNEIFPLKFATIFSIIT